MAGSYEHVNPDKSGSWSLIDNLGDAYECIEELLYLVRCFADKKDIKEALKYFYKFESGRLDPAKLSRPSLESESMPSISDYGRAYLEAKKVMSQDE